MRHFVKIGPTSIILILANALALFGFLDSVHRYYNLRHATTLIQMVVPERDVPTDLVMHFLRGHDTQDQIAELTRSQHETSLELQAFAITSLQDQTRHVRDQGFLWAGMLLALIAISIGHHKPRAKHP